MMGCATVYEFGAGREVTEIGGLGFLLLPRGEEVAKRYRGGQGSGQFFGDVRNTE